jgi:hypothetical protein
MAGLAPTGRPDAAIHADVHRSQEGGIASPVSVLRNVAVVVFAAALPFLAVFAIARSGDPPKRGADTVRATVRGPKAPAIGTLRDAAPLPELAPASMPRAGERSRGRPRAHRPGSGRGPAGRRRSPPRSGGHR